MRKWLSILVAVMAIAALVAVGCGDNGTDGGSGGDGGDGTDVAELTAQQMVKKSNEAMETMKTVAMDLDMALAVKGDAAKITDEQAKALLSSPIAVKMAGNVGNDPQKLDMTMNADAMGQTFDIGLRMDGDTVYLQYNGTWYSIPKDMASGITGATASPSAAEDAKLTDLYKQLGIDPKLWARDYTIVGEEDVNGVTTFHISQTVDMEKVATDLSKLTSSAAGLGSIVGGSTGSTDPEDLQKAIDTMKAAIKDVKVDWWIGKDDFYLYKMTASAMVDFMALPEADREGAEGIESMDFDLTLNMSDFDKDFTVEVPADAKPFEELMNDLMQSGGLSL
jgi:hypothetical protein